MPITSTVTSTSPRLHTYTSSELEVIGRFNRSLSRDIANSGFSTTIENYNEISNICRQRGYSLNDGDCNCSYCLVQRRAGGTGFRRDVTHMAYPQDMDYLQSVTAQMVSQMQSQPGGYTFSPAPRGEWTTQFIWHDMGHVSTLPLEPVVPESAKIKPKNEKIKAKRVNRVNEISMEITLKINPDEARKKKG